MQWHCVQIKVGEGDLPGPVWCLTSLKSGHSRRLQEGHHFPSHGWFFVIFSVVSPVTLIAEVWFVEENLEGVTSVVMGPIFEDANNLVGRSGSLVDQHMGGVTERTLSWHNGSASWNVFSSGIPQGPSGTPARLEFFGFFLLNGVSFFLISVLSVTPIFSTINVCLHGHNGKSTAQRVAILDCDAQTFCNAPDSRWTRLVPFSMTTPRTRCAYENSLHRERVVGFKSLVGVQLGSQGLEIGVQPLGPVFKFAHSKCRRLKSTTEGIWLHWKVSCGVWSESGNFCNLLLDGSTQRFCQFSSNVVTGSSFTELFEGCLVSSFV